MSYETIAIGDELLTGRISDTNSTFVASHLFDIGLVLSRQTVIADRESEMQKALRESANRAKVVVVFGGLGPTSDDKTVDLVSSVMECAPIEFPPARQKMEKLYRERGREVTVTAMRQVRYPEKATPLRNEVGLAPGFLCTLHGATFFFLPGVPNEMRFIFEDSVLPWIAKEEGGQKFISHVWRCLGIAESVLQEAVAEVEKELSEGLWLGFRTRYPENHLTLYGKMENSVVPAGFEAAKLALGERVKEWVFTQGHQDLEELVGEKLSEKKWRIALVESCTGGLVAERLTRVPGSSEYLWGSFVTYQLDSKNKMLGANLELPVQAVAANTTRQLAESAKQKSGVELAAAITGYVGPGGGSDRDPVGTIYLCVVGDKTWEKRIDLGKRFDREHLKWGAASNLLNLILRSLSP